MNQRNDDFRLRHLAAAGLVGAALLTGLAGCAGGEAPGVRKSRELLVQTMEASPDHMNYGLTLVAQSPSPFARQLVYERIGSDHYPTAREAVRAVVNDPPEEARPALEQAFSTKQGVVKLNAGIALARLGNEEALEWVRQEVLEKGGGLTETAAKLLAGKGHAKEIETELAKRMRSKEPSIRNEVYVLLGEIHDPWASSLLRKGLGKEFGEDREQAIASIGRSGNADLAPLLHPFINTKGLVFATLEALGHLGNPKSIPVIEKQIDHESELVRVYAAAALWRLGQGEKAAATLEPLVASDDFNVRLNIAQQLRRVDKPKAKQMLSKLATDDSGDVRLAAIRSLAEFNDGGLEPVFVQALQDRSYQVSTSALDALATAGSPTAVVQIEPLLDHAVPYVVMSAANAILAIDARGGGAGGAAAGA